MYQYTYDDISKRYIDMVYRLALARTKSAEDAGDVTQEVFLRLLEADKRFNDEEHLKAWLLRVTINRSKDLLRKSNRVTALNDDIPAPPREIDSIYFELMKLPQHYRTVVYLYYYEGYNTAELARILKRPSGTVKSQLRRGREMLKRLITEGDGELG